MELRDIPAGTFKMGSSLDEIDLTEREWRGRLLDPAYRLVLRDWLMKEYPAHFVHVDAFQMTRFPVRNDEYRLFLDDNKHHSACPPVPESLQEGLPSNHPVWGVKLPDAQAFIRWRARQDGIPWRLPSEAEWEWAAAGPTGRRYPYGDTFDVRLCNTVESGRASSSPVDAHPDGASFWGVEDMGGNVEEWTASTYQPYPGGMSQNDDLMQFLGPGYHVLRGGSFALGGDLARTRRRHGPHPGIPFRVTGFRMVVNQEQP